ncbi:hypothetical protein [Parasphingopyxis sp.]|uniref:hypothetical protein n=1 Tax=Parasphingopyxis sp. TaxID=1920299 RepID=UPI00260A322E|nr:hypothetical protein [Parasphingopyxis sp.]
MSRAKPVILTALGSLVLAATAALHFLGHAEITAWADALGDQSFFARAIPTIWLFPSVHWIAIAVALLAAAWAGIASLRLLLFGCALLLIVDAALIYAAVGPFIGSAMLIGAAVFYILAGFGARSAQ